jgi:hypothetical protein
MPRTRSPIGRGAILLFIAATRAVVAGDHGEVPRREPTIAPIQVDLVEQTERTLLLLDVEAVDGQGRPMLGLVKDDFRIRVNYLWRGIYSVDDLCPCGDATLVAPDAPNDPARAALRCGPSCRRSRITSCTSTTASSGPRAGSRPWSRPDAG